MQTLGLLPAIAALGQPLDRLVGHDARSGRTVLELLGASPHEARRHALRFRRHNLALFEKMYPHHRDRAKLIAVVKQGRQQLEEQMAREREERQKRTGARPQGWGNN